MVEERKQELAKMVERYDNLASDLMLTALALSEMLEGVKEVPGADGGRPLKYLNVVHEKAVEYVTAVQISAKYAADELMFIKQEISNLIEFDLI